FSLDWSSDVCSSDLWKDFKEACNHYFNRLHADRTETQKDEFANLEKKNACLERLKAFQLSGDKKKDLADIKAFLDEWKQYGRIQIGRASSREGGGMA